MALRSIKTSPTFSPLRYMTSVTTCSPSKSELRKLISRSLFGFVPNILLNPKSVSRLIYFSSVSSMAFHFFPKGKQKNAISLRMC